MKRKRRKKLALAFAGAGAMAMAATTLMMKETCVQGATRPTEISVQQGQQALTAPQNTDGHFVMGDVAEAPPTPMTTPVMGSAAPPTRPVPTPTTRGTIATPEPEPEPVLKMGKKMR